MFLLWFLTPATFGYYSTTTPFYQWAMSRRNGANRKQNRTSKLNSKTLCAHQHRTERQLLRDLSARSDKDGRSPALTNRMYVTTGYQEVWMTKLTSGIRGYHPHLPNEETETQKVTALSGNLPAEGHWEGLAQDLNVSSSAPELLLSVTVPSCAQKCLGCSTQIRFLEKTWEIMRAVHVQ